MRSRSACLAMVLAGVLLAGVLLAGVLLAGVVLSGCGGSGTPASPASSRLIPATSSSASRIILTARGAERIGLQTGLARAAGPNPRRGDPTVVVPPSAIVYDPSGRTYAFVNPSRLTFVEVPVSVDHITGNSAYLLSGPRAGARVVTVGAEELLGVQAGVLAQS